jgi:hypothetical protein
MESFIKALIINASTGFYKMQRYQIGKYYSPVDVDFHLTGIHNSLTINTEIFNINKVEAAFEYWYEIHKSAHESLKEY